MVQSMKKSAFLVLLLTLALALAVPAAFASTNVDYAVRNAADTADSYANAYKVGSASVDTNGTTTTITFSGASYIQYLEVYDAATNTWSYATATPSGSNVSFTFEVDDFSVNKIAKIHVIVPPSETFPGYNTVHTIQFKWSV